MARGFIRFAVQRGESSEASFRRRGAAVELLHARIGRVRSVVIAQLQQRIAEHLVAVAFARFILRQLLRMIARRQKIVRGILALRQHHETAEILLFGHRIE